MTKQEFIKDIHRITDGAGLISIQQLMQYMGAKSKDTAKLVVRGLPFWGNGCGKKYAVVDVAEKLYKGFTYH